MEESDETVAVERRVIKRYSNRKLYDTKDSRYVTLLQIASSQEDLNSTLQCFLGQSECSDEGDGAEFPNH